MLFPQPLASGSKIAIASAPGLGDGLIFHIAAANLLRMGYAPTTFSDHLAGLGPWLQGFSFASQPPLEKMEEAFRSFDAILLQHDNSPKAKAIQRLGNTPVFCFYGSHKVSKHGPLSARDFVCDPNRTMVDNLVSVLTRWFGPATADLGLRPPPGLIYRKYPKRIAIHPSSGAPEKNWDPVKFAQVAEVLEKEGWEPRFLIRDGRALCPTLEELASFLFESGAYLGNDSGPGHLASALNIPSLIIGQDEKLLRLWRPGWRPAALALPPPWIMRWKWPKKHWRLFITKNKVINELKSSVLQII